MNKECGEEENQRMQLLSDGIKHLISSLSLLYNQIGNLKFGV